MEFVEAPSSMTTVACCPSGISSVCDAVQPRTSEEMPRMSSSAITTMTATKAIIGPLLRLGLSALVS